MLGTACQDASVIAWLPVPLETDRVLVRRPAAGDEPGLVALTIDAEVRRFVGGAQSPDTARAKAAAKVMDSAWGQFVIVEVSSGGVIGSGDISRKRGPWEISYQLQAASWGYGLAAEAVGLVVGWFFDNTDEGTLVAVTQEANERSSRLLERVGATFTTAFEQYGLPQRQYEFRSRRRHPAVPPVPSD
jgi:ribosomal-protein-alanine N-acetyltransferase